MMLMSSALFSSIIIIIIIYERMAGFLGVIKTEVGHRKSQTIPLFQHAKSKRRLLQ